MRDRDAAKTVLGAMVLVMIVILLWREHSFENRIDMLCAEIGDLKSRFDPMAAETTDCVVTEDHSGEH